MARQIRCVLTTATTCGGMTCAKSCGACVAVHGGRRLSNVGGRRCRGCWPSASVWTQEIGEAGHDFQPIYVDCNRMLDLSDQGFYELVLRCLRESNEEYKQRSRPGCLTPNSSRRTAISRSAELQPGCDRAQGRAAQAGAALR
ncbi:MAG: hypothetical protein R3A10_18435 [Caldilineaceae bacterium]